MKIGLVSPYIYPLPGGVTQHVGYLYENLRLRGHDVRIISASHGPQRSSEGDVVRLGFGFSMPANGSVGTVTVSPRFNAQVRDMLEMERFDVLHFHEPFVPFLSLVLLHQSHSVNIATFHAYAGYSVPYQIASRVLAPYAARLHGRIAVSAASRHFIDRYFPGDYKIIPNGVDVDRFQRAVPIARYRDGIPNLLFVGRHEPRKGLLDMLRAFRLVRQAGVECRLLIVGSGPQEREARRYVATRRLQDVEFLGRVGDGVKGQLYRSADVFVSPATGGESFGIVLLEAMAAGVPIVASDIHGYKGVVRRGEQGLLTPPRDPQAVADAIVRLLADPALRARMAASGTERARQMSWESVTARVDDYYGFVIRRLAAREALPDHYGAPVPPSPRPAGALQGNGSPSAEGPEESGRLPTAGPDAASRPGGPFETERAPSEPRDEEARGQLAPL